MHQPLFHGLHHFALRTPELSRSVAFFEALGFHIVHEWDLPEFEITRAVMMQAPDHKSWIELFDLDAAIPLQGQAACTGEKVISGALAHICLEVGHLEEATQHIITAGAKHMAGPHALELGTPKVHVRNAIFEGPAGEIIELLEHCAFPGDQS